MVKTRLSVSLLLLSLAACATDATPVDGQGDTSVADTGGADTSTNDTAVDTGTAPDTAADTAPDVEVEALDRDEDGIADAVEGNLDPDLDGIPNWSDVDSDNDGLSDAVEGITDSDGDTVRDFLDQDADGDGFGDNTEGVGDPDGDGLENFRDLDSDGDGRPDQIEGANDTDFDGIPDPYDADDDNDGALSRAEGALDTDSDGLPSWADPDSDNDGWLDGEEIDPLGLGNVLLAPDTDNDNAPDHEDVESDSDGIRDRDERGCANNSSERANPDSDGDGISDLIERAFRGPDDQNQACDPAEGITDNVDFFFTLPFNGDTEQQTLNFSAAVRKGDVAFNMDTTGSMGGSISGLQASLRGTLIPQLGTAIEDVGFAVSSFDDFPCGGWGSAGLDFPFQLRQRITTDPVAAQAGVNLLTTHSGNDIPESGIESLFQIATGNGRIEPTCVVAGLRELVAPFDARADRVLGVADGNIGGVGFRAGAVPIVVHITDAVSHWRGNTANGDIGSNYPGASKDEALFALNDIGAKVLGVSVSSFGGSEVRTELERIALDTGAAVPPCAWDLDRPTACRAGSCCTGAAGAGTPTPAGGLCPLVYDSSSSGSGLDSAIVQGIKALVQFAQFDVTVRLRGLPVSPGVDTSCFIERVYPVFADPGGSLCASVPTLTDNDSDGTPDGFADVTPGANLFFAVEVRNDCAPESANPQVFTAYLDIVTGGGAVLDTQLVTILVPPDNKLE